MSRLVKGALFALMAFAVCSLPARAQQALLPTPTFVVFGGAPFSGSLTSLPSNLIHSHQTVGAALDIPILGPLSIEPNVAITHLSLPVSSTPGAAVTDRTMTTGDLNLRISVPINPFFFHPYLIAGAGVAHISGVATKPTADVGIGATIALTRSIEIRPEVRFGHTIFSSQSIPRLNRFTIGIGYTF